MTVPLSWGSCGHRARGVPARPPGDYPSGPMSDVPPLPDPLDARTVAQVERLLRPLARYHRFELEGVEHVPARGACLLVVHHTLATYDGFLLAGAIWERTGRMPRGLGDDTIFRIPGLAGFARRVGIVPASPEAGEELLREGHILGVAPGGMWESLRPRGERRRSRWEGRRGFVRLALRTGTPMLMAACPRADDLFTVYPSRLTDAVYRRFHWPLPVARGLGPTLVPRPLKLVGRLSARVVPPAWDPTREDAQVDAPHAAASASMASLLSG